ncbi:MAG TPA: hypothetical protein VGK19_24020 [Capsulimonadaceae bacterium]|jgi:hypothetical protein
MAQKSHQVELTIPMSPEAEQLLAALSERYGVSRGAVIERLVRDAAAGDAAYDPNVPTPAYVDLAKHRKTPQQPFDEWVREIEALPPIGPSIPDEALTSEALYADHP